MLYICYLFNASFGTDVGLLFMLQVKKIKVYLTQDKHCT